MRAGPGFDLIRVASCCRLARFRAPRNAKLVKSPRQHHEIGDENFPSAQCSKAVADGRLGPSPSC